MQFWWCKIVSKTFHYDQFELYAIKYTIKMIRSDLWKYRKVKREIVIIIVCDIKKCDLKLNEHWKKKLKNFDGKIELFSFFVWKSLQIACMHVYHWNEIMSCCYNQSMYIVSYQSKSWLQIVSCAVKRSVIKDLNMYHVTQNAFSVH